MDLSWIEKAKEKAEMEKNTKKIDYNKFCEWLQYQIDICRKWEAKYARSGKYELAISYREQKECYEYLLGVATSDDWIDQADWIIEE